MNWLQDMFQWCHLGEKQKIIEKTLIPIEVSLVEFESKSKFMRYRLLTNQQQAHDLAITTTFKTHFQPTNNKAHGLAITTTYKTHFQPSTSLSLDYAQLWL
jgi:hypothetical protein